MEKANGKYRKLSNKAHKLHRENPAQYPALWLEEYLNRLKYATDINDKRWITELEQELIIL